jgi:hypothetical protein
VTVSLKKCPMCFGRPINDVMARISSRPCSFCGGLGVLNTEASCKCGRPAVRKLNSVGICTRFECGRAVLEATK